MFGFAIWNWTDESLFIARDFFGIKPMHYTQVGGHFLYASEIKSILKFPGFEKKFNYCTLITIFFPAPFRLRLFEGVWSPLPGHYLWHDGKVETTRYWEARFNSMKA